VAGIVDVGHGAVGDPHLIELERVDALHRGLPALVLHRDRIVRLGGELALVDVQARSDRVQVGDQPQRQQGAPVDAGRQAVDLDDRRIGMRVLPHRQADQGQRQGPQVQLEIRQPRGVALEILVERRLHPPPHRLLEQRSGGDQRRDQHRQAGEGDRPAAMPPHHSAPARRTPFGGRLAVDRGRAPARQPVDRLLTAIHQRNSGSTRSS
jgi:hypothetical protein